MRHALIVVLAGGLSAFAADLQEDRALIAQAADKPAPPAAQPAPPDDVRAAESDFALARAKLELALARRALREADVATAGAKARAALEILKGLAATADRETLELQAEGVLAKVARVGGQALLGDAPATAPAVVSPPEAFAYNPARPADAELRDLAARDEERFRRQRKAAEAAGESDVEHLMDADAARIAPTDIVTYPANWAEIVAKREKYKDGAIARSSSWRDASGREWYVALYDISDIVYTPPNFSSVSWIGGDGLQAELDRAALRENSFIFRGTAEDLAAGLPLLQFFGGIDEWQLPRYSHERQRQVVEMIRAFTAQRTDQPAVISVP